MKIIVFFFEQLFYFFRIGIIKEYRYILIGIIIKLVYKMYDRDELRCFLFYLGFIYYNLFILCSFVIGFGCFICGGKYIVVYLDFI